MNNDNPITYFAEVDRRNKRTPFGIKASDRTRHVYVIGKTGMGKSTMLENMAVQDIKSGNGICFIDPHGQSVKKFLDYVPEERIEDVIYFAPFDTEHPISFNVMEDVGPDKRHLVAQGLLSAFKKIWGEDTFSDRMEHITNNTLLALLEYPGSTMLGMTKIFTDAKYRKKVVDNITDSSVKSFWTEEFAGWDERYRKDAYAAILNKVGQFTSNPLIRNIVGQSKSSFDFRDVLDSKKILLVNLSIGQVGEANANLLGSMLTTKIYLAAMSRADVSSDELAKLPNFYLYIDEFQNLANDSFADILSQARKYKLNLTIAHQYIEQMPETVHAAVFGNVGTMIAFRVGATDAEQLEKEFAPNFLAEDIVNLGFAQIYLRLMIDGIGSTPFSARTLPPITKPEFSYKNEILENSRKSFAAAKEEVERNIEEWLDSTKVKPVAKAKPSTARIPTRKINDKDEVLPIISTSEESFAKKIYPQTKSNRISLGDLNKNDKKEFVKSKFVKAPRVAVENKNQLKQALSEAMKSLEKEVKERETASSATRQGGGKEEISQRKIKVETEESENNNQNIIREEIKAKDSEIKTSQEDSSRIFYPKEPERKPENGVSRENLEKMLYVKHPEE
ncbi:type IV secretion system DNA-binding domain-containing protein [Patescibacteria group bacterium]|nr:type IV secretion system DNA-binding domain-containing protein [Patescibacteria group bacterium]